MDRQIEEAAARIEQLLEESRSGVSIPPVLLSSYNMTNSSLLLPCEVSCLVTPPYRRKDSGAQLEVNGKVLDSCTGLVAAIRSLPSLPYLVSSIIHPILSPAILLTPCVGSWFRRARPCRRRCWRRGLWRWDRLTGSSTRRTGQH